MTDHLSNSVLIITPEKDKKKFYLKERLTQNSKEAVYPVVDLDHFFFPIKSNNFCSIIFYLVNMHPNGCDARTTDKGMHFNTNSMLCTQINAFTITDLRIELN